jgi:hypothetical protein
VLEVILYRYVRQARKAVRLHNVGVMLRALDGLLRFLAIRPTSQHLKPCLIPTCKTTSFPHRKALSQDPKCNVCLSKSNLIVILPKPC